MNIEIQERDKGILNYLFKNKVASIYQMMAHLKITCRRHTLVRRLVMLVKNRVLKDSFWMRKKVYGVGNVGQNMLYEDDVIPNKYKLPFLGINRATIEHDITLNEVTHQFLDAFPGSEVKTHNEFMIEQTDRNCRRNIPDAAFKLSSKDSK